MWHKQLQQQLRALGLGEEGLAPDINEWRGLLRAVSAAYQEADAERHSLERANLQFAQEMSSLNVRVEAERDRWKAIFDAAPVGILRFEVDPLRLADANPALLQLLGYSVEELRALGGPWEIVHPEERSQTKERLEALVRGAYEGGYKVQRRFLHRNGSAVSTNLGVTLVQQPHDPPFVIAVIEDVTERARLEVELRHAQKLESVGRLASGIAHEINTPIQFVGDNTTFLQSGFKDLLSLCDTYRQVIDDLGDAVPAAVRAQLAEAEEVADLAYIRENAAKAFRATLDGVARVSTIVKAMKVFAHPDRGRVASADLNAALQSTLTVATNELKYVADVKLELGDVPSVECYLSDLNQVFLNLLVNAAHAIGDVVGATGDKGVITVRTFREGETVVVAIGDTGTGIPPEVRPHIFDPFFTTKEVGKGTGQGLAIARSVVVEKHGGSLTFDTEVGRGTTFFVRLPILHVQPSGETPVPA